MWMNVDTWTRMTVAAVSAVVQVVVLRPSRFFYIWFPQITHGIGGWGGAHESDICATLTGIKSSHWVEHESLCSQYIDRRAYSIAAAIVAPLYFYSIFSLVKTCVDAAMRMVFTSRTPPKRIQGLGDG